MHEPDESFVTVRAGHGPRQPASPAALAGYAHVMHIRVDVGASQCLRSSFLMVQGIEASSSDHSGISKAGVAG